MSEATALSSSRLASVIHDIAKVLDTEYQGSAHLVSA